MPKEFYTDRDIEDMVQRGIQTLQISDNVVLTDLAFEKARQLGMQLVRDKPEIAPSAPVRPYITQMAQARQTPPKESSPAQPSQPALNGAGFSPQPGAARRALTPLNATGAAGSAGTPLDAAGAAELRQRMQQAVIARLGGQVDPGLLDVIITRVFQSTGIK